MTSFSETRLELGLTYGASYGPRFSTAINAQANGVEIAEAEWEDPLIQINLPDKAYTRSETEYLLDFHATMKGSLTGFRIRDWSDYFVVGQPIGTGNGTVQEWQLIKTYTVGSYSVKRAITKPVAGSLVVYVNGVETASGWSVDTTTGKFTTELTGAITVAFEFDVPVRFVEDKLDFRFDAVQGTNALFTQQPITLTEIRVTPWAYPSLDPFPVSLAHQIDLGYDLGTTGGPEFDTFIAETASEWESRVARRDNPLGVWNLGDRTLTRSQVNYLIALFRIARGRAIPFGYMDYQEETVKLIRFTEDRLGVSFLAHRHSDKQAIFSLAAIGIIEIDVPLHGIYEEEFLFTGPDNNVLYSFTFTTTNLNVPNNAAIYLMAVFFDSQGTIGTFSTGDIPNTVFAYTYNWAITDPAWQNETGPPILIGTGNSVSGTVIEDENPLNPESSCQAILRFVW